MKKNIFLALVASLLFSACTLNEYKDASDTDYYREVFTVYRNQWLPEYEAGKLICYFCTFTLPLTAEIIDYKPIDVYYELPNTALTPLPYSEFVVEGDYKWEEQLSVEYEPGYITFILKYDDQMDVLPSYDSYHFLVKFPL